MTGQTRREFLKNVGLTATSAALSVLPGCSQTGRTTGEKWDRPNVVLVITDDQGYGELACHGNKIIKTPIFDKLHEESTRFTAFHVSPTCSPTRASLMTGRHEFRSGVTHTYRERERLSLDAVTIAQVLSKAGYKTGIFGKWHLGDEEPYQPHNRGFDEVFIHGAGGIGQSYKCSCGDAPGNKYFDPVIRHNRTFVKTKGYCTDVFFTQALRWIKHNKDRRFFAYIAANTPHSPLVCSEEYSKPYLDAGLDQKAAAYYGMITNIDDNVGRLRGKLDEWGLTEKTLLIFMTDNGHSMGHLYNAGMRSKKGSPYEGGTRVPAFFRWPGRTRAGVDIYRYVSNLSGTVRRDDAQKGQT
ncbi:MAG: arylsulfatase [Planctomycetota bacterium]|jgi:arylsulfatase